MDNNPHDDEQFFDPGTSDEPMQGFVNAVIWMLIPAAISLFC